MTNIFYALLAPLAFAYTRTRDFASKRERERERANGKRISFYYDKFLDISMSQLLVTLITF